MIASMPLDHLYPHHNQCHRCRHHHHHRHHSRRRHLDGATTRGLLWFCSAVERQSVHVMLSKYTSMLYGNLTKYYTRYSQSSTSKSTSTKLTVRFHRALTCPARTRRSSYCACKTSGRYDCTSPPIGRPAYPCLFLLQSSAPSIDS
jgi:hypothetical protein